VSNVLGSVNPVEEVAELAHAAGALLFVAGAQAAPHLPVDVAAHGCDVYAFSAEKMLSPMALGTLCARPVLLPDIAPHEVRDEALVARALERLRGMPGVTLVGPEEGRVGLVTFVVDGVHAHDVATALDLHGVAVRAGQHCAQPLHLELGIAASTRASFYLYN